MSNWTLTIPTHSAQSRELDGNAERLLPLNHPTLTPVLNTKKNAGKFRNKWEGTDVVIINKKHGEALGSKSSPRSAASSVAPRGHSPMPDTQIPTFFLQKSPKVSSSQQEEPSLLPDVGHSWHSQQAFHSARCGAQLAARESPG